MKAPIPKFEVHVVDHKPKMLDRERASFLRWVSTFKNGQKLELVVRKWKEKRTEDQNRYYWGVVIPILADHFGHDTPEAMHEDLKREFNPVQSRIDPGKTVGGTTTTLSTVDFFSADDSYIERIVRWAATEHSVFIPPPEKIEGG